MDLQLEKFVHGSWRSAATLTIHEPQRGIVSPCTLEYLPEYALDFLDTTGEPALSVHLPVNFTPRWYPRWAPFLLDVLPSGFGRELLVAHDGWPRPDGGHNDAAVLACGASNPAGNVRVAEAYHWLQERLPAQAEGWHLEEMQRHDADFIEYARLHGTLVAGTSTQGQAAKLWLTLHQDGLYYADSLVEDRDARAHYLVKLPRNEQDAILLRHEFYWLQLAQAACLDIHGEPFMAGGLLFFPRFDRVPAGEGETEVRRRAVESAYSLQEVAAHGSPLFHEDILATWVPLADTSRLGIDLLEYLQRDMLGYCLRVEDNHGRNTGFFLTEQGLQLTPLFDFSPMFLADDPPARSTLWRQFNLGQHTQWERLFTQWLPALIGQDNSVGLRQALVEWRPQLELTYQQFLHMDRDPRTVICEQRFVNVLGVLYALR